MVVFKSAAAIYPAEPKADVAVPTVCAANSQLIQNLEADAGDTGLMPERDDSATSASTVLAKDGHPAQKAEFDYLCIFFLARFLSILSDGGGA